MYGGACNARNGSIPLMEATKPLANWDAQTSLSEEGRQLLAEISIGEVGPKSRGARIEDCLLHLLGR